VLGMMFRQCMTCACSNSENEQDWQVALDLTNAALEDSPLPNTIDSPHMQGSLETVVKHSLFSPTRPETPGIRQDTSTTQLNSSHKFSVQHGKANPTVAQEQPAFRICRLSRTASFEKSTQVSLSSGTETHTSTLASSSKCASGDSIRSSVATCPP
jgi:hypothetical protein